MGFQLDHNNTVNNTHSIDIRVVCDGIRTPENIGMVIRVAEAFGVNEVIVNETSPGLENAKVKKTSRSADQNLQFRKKDDLQSYLSELRFEGFRLFGIELTDSSKPMNELKASGDKIVLLIGSERDGISPELLTILDASYQIEMFGRNSSINVVNALSIALYQLLSC